MFSGGALQRVRIFALGVMPYISSSIIIQLLRRSSRACRDCGRKARAAAAS